MGPSSESCQIACFVISSVEYSTSLSMQLVTF